MRRSTSGPWWRLQADSLAAAQSNGPERNCSFNQNVMVSEHSYEALMGQGSKIEDKVRMKVLGFMEGN